MCQWYTLYVFTFTANANLLAKVGEEELPLTTPKHVELSQTVIHLQQSNELVKCLSTLAQTKNTEVDTCTVSVYVHNMSTTHSYT